MEGKILRKDMSLMEMDEVLEDLLAKPSKSVRILTDLPLTKEDLQELLNKLTAVKNNMELVHRYRVSMVTAWAFALHYEHIGRDDYGSIVEELAGMPQYARRQFFETCGAVFADYGLTTYYSEILRETELYTMIVVHAGIPVYAAERFYPLLKEVWETHNMKEGMCRMTNYLEGKLGHIAGVACYDRLEQIMSTAVTLMGDCLSGEYTEAKLRKKYPMTSSRLIGDCYAWSMEHGVK